MSITTKKGDRGETSLLYGVRVSKTHQRVNAYSSVDELNTALGLCRAHLTEQPTKDLIREIQTELIQLMGELAATDSHQAKYLNKHKDQLISDESISRLEALIDAKEAAAVTFKGWSYPGESIPQAFLEQARTTCRRAERQVVALKESDFCVREELLKYLNRLSDLIWLLGREAI